MCEITATRCGLSPALDKPYIHDSEAFKSNAARSVERTRVEQVELWAYRIRCSSASLRGSHRQVGTISEVAMAFRKLATLSAEPLLN